MRRIFILLLGCLFLAKQSGAQAQWPTLQLANHSIVYLDPAADWQQSRNNQPFQQLIAAFAPGYTPGLYADQIAWWQPLGQHHYLILLKGKTDALPAGLQYFAAMQPQWKMDDFVRREAAGDGTTEVLVAIAAPAVEEITRMLQAVQGNMIRVVAPGKNYYELRLPKKQLYRLADWYGTLSISLKATPQTLNLESKIVTRAENLNAAVSMGGYDLNGEGMVLGIGDNTSGLDHADLRDRIINYNPWPFTDHGVHTNGTMAGAGIVDPDGRGFAPRATIIDHPYDNVWALTGNMVASHGMSITNNSYAAIVGNCGYAGLYDGYAALLDSICLAYPQVFHVFAAGNDGPLSCSPYPPGFGTVVGSYQTAKNVLVVANVNKRFMVNWGSSRGPIKDGRLKPEVSAVGTAVFSCKGNDTYQSADGTSMAAPQVAGLAGLLGQRYKQWHSDTLPQSAFLKAILMNGADDIGNPGPDFTYGFGIVNGLRSIEMIDSAWYFSGAMATGGTANHTITIPPGIGRLKVMLYWPDAPASLLASQKLVNDLDLSVQQGGTAYLPFVLDTAAANVNNLATTGTDHINNVEQVVVENPAAGDWQFTVNGFDVPQGPQSYYVVYLLERPGLKVTFPHAGAAVSTGDSLRIIWDAGTGTNPFTVEFSADNGASWTVVSSTIAPQERTIAMMAPAINSNQCLVRVSRNGTAETFTTAAFVVHQEVSLALSPEEEQCPGSIAWTWNSPGTAATAFQILQKKGPELVPIDTVAGSVTSYVLSGLATDSMSYVAVRPFINGTPGKQSNAIRRLPHTGNCALPVYNGDLALSEILSPQSGRQFTSSALSTNETMTVRVWNLAQNPASDFTITYQLDGAAPVSTVFNTTATTIVPASYKDLSIPGLNFSATGAHTLAVNVIQNAATDPVAANNSLYKIIRQIPNLPLDLATPFEETFESFPVQTVAKDTIGLDPAGRWDYAHSSDSGRLRSWVNNEISISGNRSLSLDAYLNFPSGIINQALATCNLATYAGTSFELRAEFDYKLHGRPATMDSNQVWLRGSDTSAWLPLFSYNPIPAPGTVLSSGSLFISDILKTAGQDFSASTQFLFSQQDTSLIAANDYGNGLTVDNFRIYRVEKDVTVKRIVQPQNFLCGGNAAQPLTVVVYNTVAEAQTDIPISYRFDGGPAITEIIPSIPGKDSISHTFATPLNLSAPGLHTLDVFIAAAGDTYTANDSILNYQIRVQPVIDSFPYLQDFESSDGWWYAGGERSSWTWGTAPGVIINKAASGSKAWFSNAGAGYNDNEHSYLYAPCLDISNLSHPMLSFSQTMEIEDCGSTLCDAWHLEFSLDEGANWQKLGLAGQGTNWYNDSVHQVWSERSGGRWQVSSIPLPHVSPGTALRLRFALNTDPGTQLEGAGIDDIHIFDLKYPIAESNSVGPVFQALIPDSTVQFISAGGLLAEANTNGQNLGMGRLSMFVHNNLLAPHQEQYIFPRSFVLQNNTPVADSVLLRFYVLETEADAYLAASGCGACTLPSDIYRTGVTRYSDADTTRENGSLEDNCCGVSDFWKSSAVRWVPYDKGYYAELKSPGLSEYWFNDGGPTRNFPLEVPIVSFDATRTGAHEVLLHWKSWIDTVISVYELQSSLDSVVFQAVGSENAAHLPVAVYNRTDHPDVTAGQPIFYRLKWTLLDGRQFYSAIRRIDWTAADEIISVAPNPSGNGIFKITWTGTEGDALQMAVHDAVGRRVWQAASSAIGFNNETTVDLSHAANGVYFLQIKFKGRQYTKKLVISK